MSTRVVDIGELESSVYFGLRHIARVDGRKHRHGEQDRAAVATAADLGSEDGDAVGAS